MGHNNSTCTLDGVYGFAAYINYWMKTNYQFKDIENKVEILPLPSKRTPWNVTSNHFESPWISGTNGCLNHFISSLWYFSFLISPQYEYSRFKFNSLNSHFKIFSLVLGFTANFISVVLSVSVNTQPRSAPLRLFFFCWVCYSVAISSVSAVPHHIPYLTTFRTSPHSVLHHIPYRNAIRGINHKCGTNQKTWKEIWFSRRERYMVYRSFQICCISHCQKLPTLP